MASLSIEGDTAYLDPQGDIVATTVDPLKAALQEAVRSGAASVVVEFTSINMIDSMGIALLIAANNSLAARSSRLRLANVNGEIMSLMKLMRLDAHMDISAA